MRDTLPHCRQRRPAASLKPVPTRTRRRRAAIPAKHTTLLLGVNSGWRSKNTHREREAMVGAKRSTEKFAEPLTGEWEAEARRLAESYVRDLVGVDETGASLQRRELAVDELKQVRERLQAAADCLRRLVSSVPSTAFAAFALALQRRCGEPENTYRRDLLIEHVAHMEVVQEELRGLVEIVDAAVADVTSGLPIRKPGHPPDHALDMLIYRAAHAYHRLSGKRPGRSKTDFGPFGRFVKQIVALVPSEHRRTINPKRIWKVVTKWHRRTTVAG